MSLLIKYRQSLSDFISSDQGQQFFNFAYSIGAAIVIWGALFKILHIRGGDMLLAIGMGTEVIMFVLTAFDKPYNYTLPVAPAAADQSAAQAKTEAAAASAPAQSVAAAPSIETATLTEQLQHLGSIGDTGAGFAAQLHALNKNLQSLNTIYEIQLKSAAGQLDSIERMNQGIKDMRDMYEKCASLSQRYCEEAEKMAANMAQLNQVYANMVKAMTVNMNMRANTDGIQQ